MMKTGRARWAAAGGGGCTAVMMLRARSLPLLVVVADARGLHRTAEDEHAFSTHAALASGSDDILT